MSCLVSTHRIKAGSERYSGLLCLSCVPEFNPDPCYLSCYSFIIIPISTQFFQCPSLSLVPCRIVVCWHLTPMLALSILHTRNQSLFTAVFQRKQLLIAISQLKQLRHRNFFNLPKVTCPKIVKVVRIKVVLLLHGPRPGHAACILLGAATLTSLAHPSAGSWAH